MSIDWRDGTAELGYWVAPTMRRRGVATRAARAMVGFAFEIGVARVWLRAASNNPASNGVARAVGFTHEGTLRAAGLDGPSGQLDAPRVDMEQWGILRGELA